MPHPIVEQIRKLPEAERRQVLDELRAYIADTGEVPLTPGQMAELQRRIALDEAGQAEWIPWEQIETELEQRQKQVHESAPLTDAQARELQRRIELYKTDDRTAWKTLDDIDREIDRERTR